MKHTAGQWRRDEGHIYFIPSGAKILELTAMSHGFMLVAVNEISSHRDIEFLRLQSDISPVLVDSGVFALANGHAEKHGMTMDEALSLAPDDIDGFHALYDKYVSIVQQIGNKAWGYIEIDQGGRENKIKTRAKLEELGLRPIPVYHPFNDGWDYFDELAENYDRICFGNVVQAETSVRTRLLATAWQRKLKYPGLWIHLLGMTPNELLNAYPASSCDSSSWLDHVRWVNRMDATVACKSFSRTALRSTYDIGADIYARNGWVRALNLGAYDAHFIQSNWRALQDDFKRSTQVPCG